MKSAFVIAVLLAGFLIASAIYSEVVEAAAGIPWANNNYTKRADLTSSYLSSNTTTGSLVYVTVPTTSGDFGTKCCLFEIYNQTGGLRANYTVISGWKTSNTVILVQTPWLVSQSNGNATLLTLYFNNSTSVSNQTSSVYNGTGQNSWLTYFSFENSLSNSANSSMDGTGTNGEGYTTGYYGNGFATGGQLRYVDIAGDAAFGNAGTGSFTFGMWVKPNTTGTNRGLHMIGDGVTDSLNMYEGSADASKVGFRGGNSNLETSGTGYFVAGSWSFVIGIRRGSATEIFVNASSVATGTTTPVSFTPNDIEMGRDSYVDARRFDGVMDEAFIYRGIMSVDQMRLLYNSSWGVAATESNINQNKTFFGLKNAGNGTQMSSFGVYFSNGTAAYQQTGLNYGDSIDNDVLPQGANTVTFFKTLFANGTVSNVTVNLTSNNTVNGTVWRLQNIYAYDNTTNTPIASFSVTATNGSTTGSASSSGYVAQISLGDMGIGNVNVSVTAPGYSTNSTLVTTTAGSELNLTVFLSKSQLVINGVFDENTLASICYNYTLTNASQVYSGSGCGSSSVNSSLIPTGTNVRVNFANASYQSRDYYVTITQSSTISLTGYLLPSGGGVQITTFVYSDSQPQGIEGALTSAYRFLNGSYVIVEQKLTDTQGKGYFYLNTFAQYQVRASYQQQSATVNSYYPNSAFILYIKLSGSADTSNLTWVFDTVSVSYSPTDSYYVSGVVPVSYTVTATENNLQYYGLIITQIFQNGTSTSVYSNNVTGSAGGGNIVVNLNTTGASNATARWDVMINFKRSTFDVWNTTYSYYPSSFPSFQGFPDNIIPNLLNNITTRGPQGVGLQSDVSLGLIAIIIALAAAVAATRVLPGDFSVDGGGIIFCCILAIFTVYGWFEWPYLALLALITFGIIFARRFL